MLITRLSVTGFKSLVDFEMDLAKFSCLVGLNGSGKSTVLQFIDFLSQLARGDIEGWLKERHWERHHVSSRLPPRKQTIDFAVQLVDTDGQRLQWKGRYNIYELRCTSESVDVLSADSSSPRKNDAHVLKVESQQLSIWKDATSGEKALDEKIPFLYQGSVLSQLKQDTLPSSLANFRRFLVGTHSFDMLAPESLRRCTRESGGSIGLGGQRLSAFVHELGQQDLTVLNAQLRAAYSHLLGVYTASLQSGWKELRVLESYGEKNLLTEARHVNDGMLRLIAIFAELKSSHEFLLFDEIENGINPELVEFLLNGLTNATQQIIVTSHSPIILNYLDDAMAHKSVIYLHKTPEGTTRALRFFDIPSLRRKLTVMGPGEAFVDTNLLALADEINALSGSK